MFFNHAFAIKPCDSNFDLAHFMNMADHVVMGKIKDSLPEQDGSDDDKKGGETLIELEQQIKGEIQMPEILINRYLGIHDLGVPKSIIFHKNNEQVYLFFVQSFQFEGDKFGLVYCSPVLEINNHRVAFKDKIYTIENLKALNQN